MKRLIFMGLMVIATSAQALTASDLFNAQTYALFNNEHVTLTVSNEVLTYDEDRVIARGDLKLTIHKDREIIIRDLETKLRNNYVDYEFPESMKNGESEYKAANKILSNGIAEYIIRATLGTKMTIGGVVLRPGSNVIGFRDKDTGDFYLKIFGEKIYVK